MGLLRQIIRAFRAVPRQAPVVEAPRPVSMPTRAPPARPVRSAAEPDPKPTTRTLKGRCYVLDGDTIEISGTRIRIGGIDAPELNHPYGKTSKSAVIAMCKGKIVTAVVSEEMSYDRVVARCYLPDGSDIAAKLVEQGLALDWAKFSGGAYRHLEPPDARKRLWRADAKQKGRLGYVKRFDADGGGPSAARRD